MTVKILIALLAFTSCLFFYLFVDRERKIRRILRLLKKNKSLDKVQPLGTFAPKEITEEGFSENETTILRALKKLFEQDKVYLNPDLTLESLARDMQVHKNVLSAVINKHLEKSFPELLGDYRVGEALRLFNDPSTAAYTIEAIGEMCGFKSRQVFHKNFRKRTGVPPRRLR